MKGQQAAPGALDRRDWESQEANPLPRTVLSASDRTTGYRRSDCRLGRRESICTERPKLRLDYWGGKCSEPQSATEHATSTSRQNHVQIQHLNLSRPEADARATNVYA